jgi:hypothetical protein
LPLLLLCAVTLLLSLTTRADAAMVLKDAAAPIKSVCSATGPLVDGGCLLDATPTTAKPFALTDLDLIGRGGDLLAGAAASALRATESITPVPLPAAAWLLAMGIGGLGLMGRRRRDALPGLRGEDGVEPLAATLRNSARTETADHRRAPVRLDGFRRLIDAFRDSMFNATRPHAFAPGRSSPRRPNGGAGTLWAATAKRGPPEGDATRNVGGVIPAPADAPAFTGFLNSTRPNGWISSLSARFFRALDAALPGPALVPVRLWGRPATDNTRNGSNPHLAPRPILPVRETGFRRVTWLNTL